MGWWQRLWSKPRTAIVIETIEGRWPEGYVPLSRRDPERYQEMGSTLRERLKKDSVPYYEIPSIDGGSQWSEHVNPEEYKNSAVEALDLARRFSEGHAVSCEPECDGTDTFCKCSGLGPCWHHR